MTHVPLKFALLEHFAEVSPLVAKPFGFYNPYALDVLLNECHFRCIVIKPMCKITLF